MSALSPDRINGIGGSEAAAVLGLSKWKTPYQVYLDKTGQSGEKEISSAMEWGLRLEPIIRQKYADVTGRTVRDPGHMKSDKYPFMLCTPDGLTDDGRVVEIKTAGYPTGWGEEGTDEIPTEYVIQCQHNMFVAGLPVADVPVLIRGNDFRLYEIHADQEIQQMMIEKEAAFWKLVEDRTPPEPITYADAIRMFAVSKEVQVKATAEAMAAIEVLKLAKATAKLADQQEEEAKFALLKVMGEADTLIDEQEKVLLTYRQAKESSRFDAKAFQAEHPDLYGQFCKVTPGSRRLLLKGEK
jgi:putative phage-type endonuclease